MILTGCSLYYSNIFLIHNRFSEATYALRSYCPRKSYPKRLLCVLLSTIQTRFSLSIRIAVVYFVIVWNSEPVRRSLTNVLWFTIPQGGPFLVIYILKLYAINVHRPLSFASTVFNQHHSEQFSPVFVALAIDSSWTHCFALDLSPPRKCCQRSPPSSKTTSTMTLYLYLLIMMSSQASRSVLPPLSYVCSATTTAQLPLCCSADTVIFNLLLHHCLRQKRLLLSLYPLLWKIIRQSMHNILRRQCMLKNKYEV